MKIVYNLREDSDIFLDYKKEIQKRLLCIDPAKAISVYSSVWISHCNEMSYDDIESEEFEIAFSKFFELSDLDNEDDARDEFLTNHWEVVIGITAEEAKEEAMQIQNNYNSIISKIRKYIQLELIDFDISCDEMRSNTSNSYYFIIADYETGDDVAIVRISDHPSTKKADNKIIEIGEYEGAYNYNNIDKALNALFVFVSRQYVSCFTGIPHLH